jgi:hypothetical protein
MSLVSPRAARRGEELPRSALRHCAAPPAGIDALKRQRGCPGRAGEFRCAPPCADIRIAVRRGEKRPRAARGRASAVCAAPLRRATRRDRRAGANLHAACIPTRPHATPSPFRVDLERGGLARGGLQLPPRGEGRSAARAETPPCGEEGEVPPRGEERSAPARRGEELPQSALRHCAAPPAGLDTLKRQRGCPGRAGEFRCAPPCADIRIAVRRGEKRPRAARGRASAVCAAPLRRATRRDRRAGANLHAACIPTRPHATPSPFRVDLERGGLARGGLQLPPRGEGRGAPARRGR